MKNLWMAILFAFLNASLAIASIVSSTLNYPTQWLIENQSGVEVYLECINHAVGLTQPIRMKTEERFPVGQVISYVWSKWWYNDGLGLNAGTWTCAAGMEKNPLDRQSSRFDEFQTDWGENIGLVLTREGSDFRIRKK